MDRYVLQTQQKGDPLEEMNKGILDRRFPDVALKPNIDFRPVPTKYTFFQIPKTEKPESKNYLQHYVETNFAPVHSNGPVKTCPTHIQIENELRGQTVPLHKGDIHIKHIPSMKSDLYAKQNVQTMLMNVNVLDDTMIPSPYNGSPMVHPIATNAKIGKDTFHNHTRTQLRQL
jgi:hypothetical protein